MNCTEVPVIKTSSEQQAWLTLICNNKHGGFQNRCGLFMCCFFGVFFPPGFLYSCSSKKDLLLYKSGICSAACRENGLQCCQGNVCLKPGRGYGKPGIQ